MTKLQAPRPISGPSWTNTPPRTRPATRRACWACTCPGAVVYALAPPLQQGPDTPYGTVEGLQRWFATFDGPVGLSYRDVEVTADGSVGYAHTLTRMTAFRAATDLQA